MSIGTCGHIVTPERRSSRRARFLSEHRNYEIGEVISGEIHLDVSPSEYNSSCPTPLDVDALFIDGIPYASSSTVNPLERLYSNAIIAGTLPSISAKAAEEIEFLQGHRQVANIKSMERLREAASKRNDVLSFEEAEGIMQVRAGVARVGALLKLLTAYPEIGSIEYFKATRPLCARQFLVARQALGSIMGSLNSSEYDFETDSVEVRPYRTSIDERHSAIVTKQLLATAAVGGYSLDLISRSSYIAVSQEALGDDDEFARLPIRFGDDSHSSVNVLPISISAYARIS